MSYGIRINSDGDWYCLKCNQHNNTENQDNVVQCSFCGHEMLALSKDTDIVEIIVLNKGW